jgi:hypothetical protein
VFHEAVVVLVPGPAAAEAHTLCLLRFRILDVLYLIQYDNAELVLQRDWPIDVLAQGRVCGEENVSL